MTTSRQPNIRSVTTPTANTTGVARVGSKLQSCYEDMLYKPVASQILNRARRGLELVKCSCCEQVKLLRE